MRLIDADALHEALKTKQKWVVRCGDKHNEGYTYDQVHFAIDDAPTIDAVEVVRGEWIDKGWKGDWQFETDGRGNCWYEYECSECGFRNKGGKSNFCPQCGARMKGVDDE